MTPQEFADVHSLSLAEAEMVLARRNPPPIPSPLDRAAKAAQVLAAAQKRTGVQPVSVEGDELTQVYDPDADVGLGRFYKKTRELQAEFNDSCRKADDWEEPP